MAQLLVLKKIPTKSQSTRLPLQKMLKCRLVGCSVLRFWALKLGYSSKVWALEWAVLAMDLAMAASFPPEENPVRLNRCRLSDVPSHQTR
jgi:hypothetical protein